MPALVDYMGEIFYHPMKKGNNALIFTKIREKGLRHGFKEIYYDRYETWVDIEKIKIIMKDSYQDIYRVKYRDHFFCVIKETTNNVLLMAPTEFLGELYNFTQENRDSPYTKWVKRKETTPIDVLKNRYALYKTRDPLTKGYENSYWEIVFDIMDERDHQLLISSDAEPRQPSLVPWGLSHYKGGLVQEEDGWSKNGNRYQKWVSRDAVLLYMDYKEPLRY